MVEAASIQMKVVHVISVPVIKNVGEQSDWK